MQPITFRKEVLFDDHHCTYHKPCKKARSEEAPHIIAAHTPFLEGLDRLQEGLMCKSLAIHTALNYLTKHFHELVVGLAKTKLMDLYKITSAECLICAGRMQQFIDKDKHFAFAHLPRDIRKIIISYLGKCHYWTTLDFFKGSRDLLVLDWSNVKEGYFWSTNYNDYFRFLSRLGNQLNLIDFTYRFREDLFPENEVFMATKVVVRVIDLQNQALHTITTKLVNLEELHLVGCFYDDSALTPLKKSSTLRKLHIDGCGENSRLWSENVLLEQKCFKQLERFDVLTSLHLKLGTFYIPDLNMFRPPSFSFLRSLPQLLNLTLEFRLSQDLECITHLTQLSKLSLTFDEASIDFVESMDRIKSLKLARRNDHRILSNYFTKLTALTKLKLVKHSITNLTLLLANKRLKFVNLTACTFSQSPFPPLATLTGLSKVSLAQCNLRISNKELLLLQGLTSLHSLNLSSNHSPEVDGFKLPDGLKSLERLKCSSADVSDSTFHNQTSLRQLKIDGNKRTDFTGISLVQLTNLTYLKVQSTLISVPVLLQLAHLPKLEEYVFQLHEGYNSVYKPIEEAWKKRFM